MPTHHLSRTAAAFTALAAMALLTGCQSLGMGQNQGPITTQVAASPPKVTRAARQAVKDIGLILIDARSSQLQGLVEARTQSDQPVTIQVMSTGEQVSRMRIKVGSRGNRNWATRIAGRVQNAVGAPMQTGQGGSGSGGMQGGSGGMQGNGGDMQSGQGMQSGQSGMGGGMRSGSSSSSGSSSLNRSGGSSDQFGSSGSTPRSGTPDDDDEDSSPAMK